MLASGRVAAGFHTREAVYAQPEWLGGVDERVGTRRLPPGRVVFTGCGTSFHAAQTGGEAIQALEAVLAPPQADLLVAVSHEGSTPLTLEAARAFDGPVWAVTGAPESPLAELAAELVLGAPAIEQSWCHTASYTTAVATLQALRGDPVGRLAERARALLAGGGLPASNHDRFLVVGAGRAWPTAQEVALKLREGVFVAAEAHHTEELLHGHLAAVDETVRAFVLGGEGRAAERAHDAVRALEEIGAEVTPVPSEHPAVAAIPFHLLVLALAERRGVDPDRIRRDDERWARARAAYT
jgi:glutamine---fructose-6-phosphate transaminase (isomerizing)